MKKSLQHPNIYKNKTFLRTVFILLAILLLFFGLWWLLRNQSLYTRDKAALLSGIQDDIDALRLPGVLTYSGVHDDGCDDRNSVGLATRTNCEVSGHKLYLTSGSLATNLQSADAALKKEGFQPRLFSGQTSDDFQQGLNGNNGFKTMLGYIDGSGRTSALLSVYYDKTKLNDPTVKKLIEVDRIAVPGPNEYLYGVYFQGAYFYCESGSVFKLPCPSAPSPIKY